MNLKKNLWMQNTLLLGLLGFLGYLYLAGSGAPAHAAGGGWETAGVMAVATPGANNERLVLIDTKKQVICVYRNAGLGRFRLVGARSYKYDVEVKDSSNSNIEKGNGMTYFEMKAYYEALEKAAPKK
jgi:hypothetical protein